MIHLESNFVQFKEELLPKEGNKALLTFPFLHIYWTECCVSTGWARKPVRVGVPQDLVYGTVLSLCVLLSGFLCLTGGVGLRFPSPLVVAFMGNPSLVLVALALSA